MSREADFIGMLRPIAGDPAARGLMDDAALLPVIAGALVVTHDMIVEGVHYLPGDKPQDVAWKLVAVNLSDLAAKGAKPLGLMLGYALAADAGWDAAFVEGLAEALRAFDVPLLGGDTVAMPAGAPRALGMTAIGRAPDCGAPDRRGAHAGDDVWVTGTIGDAGAGLAIARGDLSGSDRLLSAYTRPLPQLSFGQAIARHVHAMADVSDGLLIDAARMGGASGVAVDIALERVPLAEDYAGISGSDADAILCAAQAGDDYQLLFAAPRHAANEVRSLGESMGVRVTHIGTVREGNGLFLSYGGLPVALPAQLGFEHSPG